MTHHSRKCAVIIGINRNENTSHCVHCARDINHIIKYRQELPSNVDEQSHNDEQCDDGLEESSEVPAEVILSNNDNQDLISLVHQISAKAPQFQKLLHSQLVNAKHQDPRQRRWDKDIISLCLHSWTQYSFLKCSISFKIMLCITYIIHL